MTVLRAGAGLEQVHATGMLRGVRGSIGLVTVEPEVSKGTAHFMRAIGERGGMPVVLNSRDLTVHAAHEGVQLLLAGREAATLSSVVGRGGAHITDQGLVALGALERGLVSSQGAVPTINRADALMVARSKALTRDALAAHGVPQPDPTFRVPIGDGLDAGVAAAADAIGGPLVIKASRDMGGNGIRFLPDASDGAAIAAARDLAGSGRGGEVVVQPWYREAAGRDIGVYVVRSPEGDHVPRAAFMRVAPPGQAASNTSAGGTPHGLRLGDVVPWEMRAADGSVESVVDVPVADVAELAARATAATGLDAARPDIIMTRDGLRVLEVNGSFGWSDRVQRMTGHDVPGDVVDLAVARAREAGRWS